MQGPPPSPVRNVAGTAGFGVDGVIPPCGVDRKAVQTGDGAADSGRRGEGRPGAAAGWRGMGQKILPIVVRVWAKSAR